MRLTRIEKQILKLTADGDSAKMIASKLKIGESTVGTYRYSMHQKLGAVNGCQAVALAIRSGIIT